MARELVYSFGANTQGVDEGVQQVKAALDDLLKANIENARAQNVIYSEMTSAQQEQFRARFDSEAEFQMASLELRNKRSEAENAAIREYNDRTKKLYADVTREAEDASKAIADTTEDGFGKAGDSAKDAGKTITDEVGGALEGLDGTAEGATSSVLRWLGGLAALIPGIGGAIGAGLATAGSIFVKGFFDDIDAAEKRVDGMADHFIKSTTRMLSEQSLIDVYNQFFNDEEMSQRAQKVADATGLPLQTVLVEMAKNGDGIKEIIDDVQVKIDELVGSGANQREIIPLSEARNILIETQTEWTQARDRADTYNRGLDLILNSTEKLQTAAEIAGERLDRTALPRRAEIDLDVDIDAADRALAAWQARKRQIKVQIIGETRDGRVAFP